MKQKTITETIIEGIEQATPEERGFEIEHLRAITLANTAPELLETLEGLTDAFEPYVDTETDSDIQDRERGWILQARAVIAKARITQP